VLPTLEVVELKEKSLTVGFSGIRGPTTRLRVGSMLKGKCEEGFVKEVRVGVQ